MAMTVLLFPILGFMVVSWLVLVSRLFTYLRENHPNEYRKIGEPALFTNNTPKNNMQFLKFILGKRHSKLKDDVLVGKCRFLQKHFYLTAALYCSMALIVIVSYASS
jgi:hypothetical protein